MSDAVLLAPAAAIGLAAEPVAKRNEMPLPHDLQSFATAAILMLLVLIILYFTGEIVLPILFAFLLNLLLQPAMTTLTKLYVPKTVAAMLIILFFIGGVTGLGFSLSGPAAEWIAKAPQSLARIEQRFSAFTKPVASVQKASQEVEKIAGGPGADANSVGLKGPGLGSVLFSGTRTMLAEFATMVLLLFFLLCSGDLFLRRLVEILPTLSDKKQAVDIWHEITRNISGYLVTISLMNAAVGIATAVATYMFGLSNPILWGVLAFVLNYILILGPLSGVAILFLAGLLTFDTTWQALLPAASYLAIHLTESAVTPVLLARRFELNPVLVIVSLLFWYWMWGIAGALLAVPLLASFKIVCDRIRPLMALGHFIGGENHT
jgi:predicted PurR-regulated permease PerM